MHGGGEEEGWGANLASTVLLLDALVRGGNPGAVWYKPDLPQRPHPLARWLGAHRSAVLVVQICAPCLSFRCRSPGAHVARYFFTLHSYFLLSRRAPRGLDPRRGPKPPALAVLREKDS